MTTTDLLHVAARDAPIACTLGPEDLRARTRDLAGLARRALRSRAPIDGGVRLTFARGAEVERELRAAVSAEASCCSFLTMTLRRADGALVLDVPGPQAEGPVIAQLFAPR